METKGKSNWSFEEYLLLTKEMHLRKRIIKRKFSITMMRQDKKDAWKEIANKINASLTLVLLYPVEYKKMWFNILSEGCQEIAAYKEAAAATGKL